MDRPGPTAATMIAIIIVVAVVHGSNTRVFLRIVPKRDGCGDDSRRSQRGWERCGSVESVNMMMAVTVPYKYIYIFILSQRW